MAEASVCASSSSVCVNELPPAEPATTLRLKLRKPKSKKKVVWTSDTVDNEHMNKKKSKCCCIYEKPHQFGESSSDTEDECEHCHGHVEIKKKRNPDQIDPAPTPAPSDTNF